MLAPDTHSTQQSRSPCGSAIQIRRSIGMLNADRFRDMSHSSRAVGRACQTLIFRNSTLCVYTAALVRVLRDAPRPGPRHCHRFRGLLPALRAAHPRRQVRECRLPPDQARQGLGLNVSRGSAHATHAHQKLPEAVVELLDVSEHPHGHIVLRTSAVSPCSSRSAAALDG